MDQTYVFVECLLNVSTLLGPGKQRRAKQTKFPRNPGVNGNAPKGRLTRHNLDYTPGQQAAHAAGQQTPVRL